MGGSVCARTTGGVGGFGFAEGGYSRGQREGREGLAGSGSRREAIREDNGRGGMGFCMREDTEGRGKRGGRHEDNGRGARSCSRGEAIRGNNRRGGFGFAGEDFDARTREGRDGLPGSRGQRDGEHSCSRGARLFARTTGRGRALGKEGRGMGWRGEGTRD